LVPRKVLWSQINDSICAQGKGLVKNIELFDVYEGKSLPADKKSLAFHIVLQSFERTLREEEVKKITGQIIEKLKTKFGAELRK
jgi:phenylalanyl-tRNA synthetase beta chain